MTVVDSQSSLALEALAEPGFFEPPMLRYDLNDEEIATRTQSLLQELAEQTAIPENGIIAAIVPSNSPYADIVRTYEIRNHFYDTPEAIAPHEPNSFFLFVADYDAKLSSGENAPAVAHVFRITKADDRDHGFSGVETVDDLIETNQLTMQDVADYYGLPDLMNTWSVGANIAIPDVVGSMKKPYGAFGYKTIFEICNSQGITNLFTALNAQAIKSLSRIGVTFELMCGRDDLQVPSGTPGEFAEGYKPYMIPVQDNKNVFHDTPGEMPRERGPLGKVIAALTIRIVEVPPMSVL